MHGYHVGKSPLRRVQREMIVVVVSKNNDCEYCQMHHAAAVNYYWKDEAKIEQLKSDYTRLELSEIDMQLCKGTYTESQSQE
ncbi:MAG: carboxymuconolactone decarboxylase family protein [Crocinitomicaceae bacterium]